MTEKTLVRNLSQIGEFCFIPSFYIASVWRWGGKPCLINKRKVWCFLWGASAEQFCCLFPEITEMCGPLGCRGRRPVKQVCSGLRAPGRPLFLSRGCVKGNTHLPAFLSVRPAEKWILFGPRTDGVSLVSRTLIQSASDVCLPIGRLV